MPAPTISRQVYIMSDLHLGGVYHPPGRGFRLCTHVPVAIEFIKGLTRTPEHDPKVELVINGDLVDFLAEANDTGPKWSAFNGDPTVAVKKFDAIAGRDPEFFAALREFLARGHRLVILLGNHDIELSLPQVRHRFEQLIGVTGRSNFEFIYDGEAYPIGNALIEHGNRYDSFNVVNFDHLRQLRSLLSRRQTVPPDRAFAPPPGSKMVAEVMNPIKERFSFVDMLKPETGAVVPMLLALDPSCRKSLGTVAGLVLESSANQLETPALPAIGGDISSRALSAVSSEAFGSDIGSFAADLGGPVAAKTPASRASSPVDRLLAEQLGTQAAAFSNIIAANGGTQKIGSDISTFETVLGFTELLLAPNRSALEQRLPALLMAMRALHNDQSANEHIETAKEYRDAALELGRGKYNYVIFGHTHQAKDVDLGDGVRYFNSGCWCDVMAFPDEIVRGDDAAAMAKLREFAEAMKANDFSQWITFKPTYVRLDVEADDHVHKAELCHFPIPVPPPTR